MQVCKMIFTTTFLTSFSVVAMAQGGPNATTPNAPPSHSNPGAPPLSDAQISSVLQVANKAEIEAGQLALKKSQNAEVKKYAQEMVAAHKKASLESDRVPKSMKLKTQEATAAADMKTTGEQTLSTLTQLNGAEFDKAYINNQISMHQEVLTSIDTQLLPAAKSAPLKALLQKMRPDIEAHMKHAEAIKAKLL